METNRLFGWPIGSRRRSGVCGMRKVPSGQRVRLHVSSRGGHFAELLELVAREPSPGKSIWAVPRTDQTEAGVLGSHVAWMMPIGSREFGAVVRGIPSAWRLHRRVRPAEVVTTGAAQAIPHLLCAAVTGTKIRYIESATRFAGPSLTGRIATLLPRTTLVSQTLPFGPRWVTINDIFAGFDVRTGLTNKVEHILVSVGTERFPFERAISSVRDAVQGQPVVTQWQCGNTPGPLATSSDLVRQWYGPDEMARSIRRASVVVVHGGVGSILSVLESGKVPVVLPRDPQRGEHVDDHQLHLSRTLAERGLIVPVGPDETMTWSHLERAASLTATKVWASSEKADMRPSSTGYPSLRSPVNQKWSLT